MKKFTLAFSLALATMIGYAQITNRENYDIKRPKNINKDCKKLYDVLKEAPEDVRFGTAFSGDSIFLIYNDFEWFSKIIESKNDGIAVDIMQSSQYQCDNISRFAGSWSHRGLLLPPLYREGIKKRMTTPSGNVKIFAGMIPSTINKENVEVNYILLNNKNLCYSSSIINLDVNGWKLLEMGMYYDTLTPEKIQEKYKELSKTLHFTIPFERNKSEYKPEDIKPLYDSLQITDYAIKTISIKAYTSVEGSYERNLKLQNQRAQSIVAALQSFQSETIESSIEASENWVEFLNDIAATGYTSWMTLSKDEIKEKLKSPTLLSTLEPVLRKHRKALIQITLEKRLSYRESNQEELRKYFQQTIAQKNIDEALYLQQIIFYKIQRQEIPDHFIQELEIPSSLEYGSLLINNASFLYENNSYEVFEAIKTFEELDRIIAKNPKIKYNLCALKLQSWLQSKILVDPPVLKKEIESLRKIGIHDNLVRRLLINYHIILSESHIRNRHYVEKDKAVQFNYESYKPLQLKDHDLVNLAKYFSYYSKFDWARKTLEPRIKSLNVSEDLVFYYLSLTIYDKRYTSGPSYRTIMLNAIDQNKDRFCHLFDPIGKGGISFQLLDDNFIKKTFCENCQDLIRNSH